MNNQDNRATYSFRGLRRRSKIQYVSIGRLGILWVNPGFEECPMNNIGIIVGQLNNIVLHKFAENIHREGRIRRERARE